MGIRRHFETLGGRREMKSFYFISSQMEEKFFMSNRKAAGKVCEWSKWISVCLSVSLCVWRISDEFLIVHSNRVDEFISLTPFRDRKSPNCLFCILSSSSSYEREWGKHSGLLDRQTATNQGVMGALSSSHGRSTSHSEDDDVHHSTQSTVSDHQSDVMIITQWTVG